MINKRLVDSVESVKFGLEMKCSGFFGLFVLLHLAGWHEKQQQATYEINMLSSITLKIIPINSACKEFICPYFANIVEAIIKSYAIEVISGPSIDTLYSTTIENSFVYQKVYLAKRNSFRHHTDSS